MSQASATIDAVAEKVTLNVRPNKTALVHVKGGEVNATGVNLTFEGTANGTDWFALLARRTNAATDEATTGTLALNAGVLNAYAHRIDVTGLVRVRARCTAVSAGDVVVTITAD